jgi:hypothetical protein
MVLSIISRLDYAPLFYLKTQIVIFLKFLSLYIIDRPNGNYGLFQVWETLLQEVEVDSAVVADIANCLNRQVSRPMIDGTFHRKLEARKIFQHREQLENALEKASQQLDKVRAVLYILLYQFKKII